MVHRLDPKFKMLMHPIDAKEGAGPTGEGWIIQIVCHHYNPYPDLSKPRSASSSICPLTDRRRTSFGPIQFLTDKVLPKLNRPATAALRRHPRRRGLDDDREGMDDREGPGATTTWPATPSPCSTAPRPRPPRPAAPPAGWAAGWPGCRHDGAGWAQMRGMGGMGGMGGPGMAAGMRGGMQGWRAWAA